jgi:hypothetical protein
MATFVPNVTMDNKHKIFAIVKSNDRSWPSIVGLASLYFQSSNFNNFFFFNSPKFTRAFCRQTFLISQNGEFSPHEKTLHGPCVFLHLYEWILKHQYYYHTWDGCCITHGMIAKILHMVFAKMICKILAVRLEPQTFKKF